MIIRFLIELPDCVPSFFVLQICRDGKIQLNYEWSWWWPQKFGIYRWFRNVAVIAPFWATTDTFFAFKKHHSRVYYQIYEENKESSKDTLAMATKNVRQYIEGFSNFQASWVLVVTWENLCPYVYYPYYYYYYGDQEIELNCRWVSKYVWLIKLVHTHSYYILKQWIASKARFDCLLKIQFEILFAIHLRTFTRGVYALKYCNRCGNK